MRLLREAGFKIHAHWMPNLLGATPEDDVADFRRLFSDADFRPDELKIYPCSLVASADLVRHWEAGEWRPYTEDELTDVLVECMRTAPEWVRLTRIVRDIPSPDIVVGNKHTNFRELVARELERRGLECRDIRAREIRNAAFDEHAIEIEATEYVSSVGREVFFQALAPGRRIVGFLRLSLPNVDSFVEELGASAVIREVHVYGSVVEIGAGPDRDRNIAVSVER